MKPIMTVALGVAALATSTVASCRADARTFDQRLHDLPVAYETAYCGFAVADSAITNDIIKRGIGYEANPLLGKHPSTGKLAALAVGKCIGHAAITSVLQDHAPARAVKVWEIFSVGIQGGVVVSNLTVRF